jgi:hypothetical protein
MDAFEEGYAFLKNKLVFIAVMRAASMSDQVDAEIAKLIHDLNAFEASRKAGCPQGDIAEFWHANTLTSMQPPVIQRTELCR